MMSRRSSLLFRILIFLVLSVGCLSVCYVFYRQYIVAISQMENACVLLVSKQDMSLRLVDYKGEELFYASVACGSNYGDKQQKGDRRTPEGIFQVADIQNASEWKHDFDDGKGSIEGAYGPYFIRLNTPGHKGIGIHGTHDSLSIGTRVTEGCIRLKNEDLKQLVSLIHPPLTVIITPAAQDEFSNSDLERRKVK